jgi:CRP-like cAMP-binding protein
MVPRNDLKRIYMLSDMPDGMLDRLAGIARLYIYSAKMPLFDSGENLKHFYMVLTGRVSLSIDLVTDVSITLGTVGQGHACGVSAFIPESRSSSKAVCDEPSELIVLSADEVFALFEEDWDLAYQLTSRIVRLFKAIMDHRTSIFLKTLRNNPEVQKSMKQTQLAQII